MHVFLGRARADAHVGGATFGSPFSCPGLLLGDLKIHDAARDVLRLAIDRATAGGVVRVPPRELADLYCHLGVELVELDSLEQGSKRVRKSQLQRLISRSFSTRFG